MTISTTKNRINQLADGIQTVFPYDFIVLDASQMYPYFDNVVQVTGFTVNGVGDAAGGDVTFDVAPSNGVTVTLQRLVDETQLVDYQPYDPFPSETHETALDKLTLITQQNTDSILRSLQLPVDTSIENLTLPNPEALKFLQWKSDLSGFKNINVQEAGLVTITDNMLALLAEDTITDVADLILALAITAANGSAVMPAGTTAQRDGVPVAGYMRHNTDFNRAEEFDGTNWKGLGGAGGAGGDAVFYENDQVVNNDYTLTAGKNAMSAGDISIAIGVTVTVPDGAIWTVV